MNNSDLKTAARRGDLNLLYSALEHDPNVLDSLDVIPFVETPLHIAAVLGHVSFATKVMRMKPSLACKLNTQGWSPIHLALHHDQRDMVERFVQINPQLVRLKGREGTTPFHFVCCSGDIELIGLFLRACPECMEDLNVRGETSLHLAAKNNRLEAIQVLVGWLRGYSFKFQETVLRWKDEEGNTVLHISALMNNPQMVALMIGSHMYLNDKNMGGSTALDIAVSDEIKTILVKVGAKPGSSLTEPSPNHVREMKPNVTWDIPKNHCIAGMVVAALIAMIVTYKAVLSPPGGFYRVNVGDGHPRPQEQIGKSVMPQGFFIVFSIVTTTAFLLPTVVIEFLTLRGLMRIFMSCLLMFLNICFTLRLVYISPSKVIENIGHILLLGHIFYFWLRLFMDVKGYFDSANKIRRNSMKW